MFVAKIGSGEKAYVYLFRCYRKDGKIIKERVQSFGRYDALIKDNPNAFEELKAKYNTDWDTVRRNETSRALQEISSKQAATEPVSDLPLLNYSHYILKEIWVKELGLQKFFSTLQKAAHTRFTGNLNRIVSTMVFLKAYAPSSVASARRKKAELLGAPLENVGVQQMYWCLDVLADNKDRIMRLITTRLQGDKGDHKRRMVFYDVTNIYFETPLSDEEADRLRKDCEDKVIAILDKALQDGVIKQKPEGGWGKYRLQDAPPQISAELRSAMYFRMRGFSKEHRYDLPLVSIALVIDENAVPIDVEIFSGCASEFKTMKDSIEAMKNRHGIKNVVVVADRGLNSAANLQMLLDHGYGFIVAQKVTNLGKAMTEKMLDESGYEEERILRGDNKEVADVIRRKIVDWEKTDTKGHKVSCKLVLCHSKKREMRDHEEFLKNVAKARDAVNSEDGVPAAQRNWRSFVRPVDHDVILGSDSTMIK